MYEFSCFPKFICDNKTLGIWIINRDLRAIVSRLRNLDGDINDANNTITFENKLPGGKTGRRKGSRVRENRDNFIIAALHAERAPTIYSPHTACIFVSVL